VERVDDVPRRAGLLPEVDETANSTRDIELVGESTPGHRQSPRHALMRRPPPRPWPVILAAVTFAVDLLAVIISVYLAKVVAPGDGGRRHLAWGQLAHLRHRCGMPVVFTIYGLYDLRRPTHATAELQHLFNAVLMSVLLVVLITFVARIQIPRSFVVWLLAFSLVTIIVGRLMTRRLGHALNSRAITSVVTLIAGTNDEARALARDSSAAAVDGYRLCGFVEDKPSGFDVIDGLPVFVRWRTSQPSVAITASVR